MTVTVNEDAILKIETPEDRFEHGDTEVILQSAKEKFIPRIIENQSLNVDVVSGATQSCAGIRAAARAALRQAFEANEVDPSAVGKFDQKVDLAVKSDAPAEELEADVLVVGLGHRRVHRHAERLREASGTQREEARQPDRHRPRGQNQRASRL